MYVKGLEKIVMVPVPPTVEEIIWNIASEIHGEWPIVGLANLEKQLLDNPKFATQAKVALKFPSEISIVELDKKSAEGQSIVNSSKEIDHFILDNKIIISATKNSEQPVNLPDHADTKKVSPEVLAKKLSLSNVLQYLSDHKAIPRHKYEQQKTHSPIHSPRELMRENHSQPVNMNDIVLDETVIKEVPWPPNEVVCHLATYFHEECPVRGLTHLEKRLSDNPDLAAQAGIVAKLPHQISFIELEKNSAEAQKLMQSLEALKDYIIQDDKMITDAKHVEPSVDHPNNAVTKQVSPEDLSKMLGLSKAHQYLLENRFELADTDEEQKSQASTVSPRGTKQSAFFEHADRSGEDSPIDPVSLNDNNSHTL